jgi:hypothetical protein
VLAEFFSEFDVNPQATFSLLRIIMGEGSLKRGNKSLSLGKLTNCGHVADGKAILGKAEQQASLAHT